METMFFKGVKRGLVLKGTDEENKIVEEFGKLFMITFSRKTVFKNSDYNFVFLKPEYKFREKFNLSNELLLLFSDYSTFETRSMDFVDKTLQDFDNRLDKVCIVLVSRDEKIQQKIEKQNTENKDSKIIIPFTYSEFKKGFDSECEIENRFRKYFYSRDLFAIESPLQTDAYFYGRNNLVQTFYDKYSIGEHSGLFGLRKVGKTSVLFSLERLISAKNGVSIYFDCQNPSIHKSDWNELLYKIVKELVVKYKIDYDLKENNYTEKNASEEFKKDIYNIYKLLDKKRILFIFDEIEHISFKTSSNEKWRNGSNYLSFWQTIRAIYQNNQDVFTFIVAGVNPMCVEQPYIDEYDNPIFSMLQPVYLKLFTVENVKDMVKSIGSYMGLEFDEEIYTYLTEDYGGHPFLIRKICSFLAEDIPTERPYRITKFLYQKKKEENDIKIYEYVEMILSILSKWYPEEYEMLKSIILNEEEAHKHIDNYQKIIKHLLGYGIIKNEDNRYYITIDAVKKYIYNKAESENNITTKEGLWKEVTVRRNAIEEKLRKIILTTLSAKYGGKKAREIIIDSVRTKDKRILEGKKIQEVIQQHLFFLDLCNIIEKKWEDFSNIFNEKDKFKIFTEYINSCRIDAHAKTLDKYDSAILIIAFQWIEEKIENILM